MSHYINTILIEEAVELIDQWEGTLHAELLRMHLKNHDLDALRNAVLQARGDWYDLEERTTEYDEVI